jgi:UDP-N-acetyl-D-mannosaminuronic acid dehydrogenase
MKICVLGLGYIGLPTALLLAAHGADVVGVDVKQSVVDCLSLGNLPFSEPGLEDLYSKARCRFCVRSEPEAADVFLIAVPTPLDPATRVSNLAYARSAADMIVPHRSPWNQRAGHHTATREERCFHRRFPLRPLS